MNKAFKICWSNKKIGKENENGYYIVIAKNVKEAITDLTKNNEEFLDCIQFIECLEDEVILSDNTTKS